MPSAELTKGSCCYRGSNVGGGIRLRELRDELLALLNYLSDLVFFVADDF